VEHSLSPRLHNAAYKALGIASQYVYCGATVDSHDLPDALSGLRALKIQGASITMPYKEAVIPLLDEVDPVASTIGAVNTIVQRGGRLIGYNTDWLGVVLPIEERRPISGCRIGVIGTGGAARAAAVGLASRGGKITIFGRSVEKGQALALMVGGHFSSLEDPLPLKNCDVIFHATPVGMGSENSQECLVPENMLSANQLVFESLYHPPVTELLRRAARQGASVLTGRDMLLYQAFEQFRLFTGIDAPREVMREALRDF
jgi:shikimate dehydrogenase